MTVFCGMREERVLKSKERELGWETGGKGGERIGEKV